MWLDPYFPNNLVQDTVGTVITFAVALAWLQAVDALAHCRLIEPRFSRKIIHIGAGPLFVLCWRGACSAPRRRPAF